jgi:tetratricopeptide (TPR) repeat protein
LEERAADDVVTLGLRASWLRAQGHGGDIETLVEEWAGRMLPTMDVPRRVQFAEGLANLYQRAGLYACAERWYRRTLAFQPADFEPLVRAIAAQGRIPEALNVCAEAAKKDSSVRPAACACLLLRAKGATPEDMRHWEPFLDKALRAHRDNVELLNNVASVRIVQGRTDEAIELYRQILRRQTQHFTALNNLATLLSECSSPEKRREAREYIDRAIDWFGPRPELLDTKGTILLGEEKPEQAAGLFKSAASGLSSDPRCCLHLAMAYGKLGRLDQARDALRQAQSSKLDRQVLTRLDRERLVELEKKLGS